MNRDKTKLAIEYLKQCNQQQNIKHLEYGQLVKLINNSGLVNDGRDYNDFVALIAVHFGVDMKKLKEERDATPVEVPTGGYHRIDWAIAANTKRYAIVNYLDKMPVDFGNWFDPEKIKKPDLDIVGTALFVASKAMEQAGVEEAMLCIYSDCEELEQINEIINGVKGIYDKSYEVMVWRANKSKLLLQFFHITDNPARHLVEASGYRSYKEDFKEGQLGFYLSIIENTNSTSAEADDSDIPF